jgi:hypothetical protein
MSSFRPPPKLTNYVKKDDFVDALVRLFIDPWSKVALWIMAISTLVLALPVLWQILKLIINAALTLP